MLMDMGTKIIQSAQQKDNATLLIVVRDFMIEDDPSKTTRGLGTCYARMLFYLGKDGAFTKEKPCEGFFETGNNLDVTNLVLKLASGVLGQWMEEVSNANAYADIAPQSLTNILDGIKNEYSSFPIYQTPPHKGIYYTLEQFLNNTPADTLFIKKSHHTDYGTVTYFFTTKDGKKKEKNLDRIACYAVYDGSNWYKKTDRGIYSMDFTDGDFYYNEAGKGKVVRGVGLGMFGLAGAVTEAMLYTDKDMTGKALVLYKVRLDPFNNSCHFIHRIL